MATVAVSGAIEQQAYAFELMTHGVDK